MAKIDELRRYLQGEYVPEVSPKTILEDAAERAARHAEEDKRKAEEQWVEEIINPDANAKPGLAQAIAGLAAPKHFPIKFKINTAGDDARLLGGKFKQRDVSEISKTQDGASYLDWMLTKGPPPELETIIRKYRTFMTSKPGVQTKPPLTRTQRQKAAGLILELDDDGNPIL